MISPRYPYYLDVQTTHPTNEIVTQGQTYFAIQTRQQALSNAIRATLST